MDLRDQLQITLGDAYTLERELGGGGMSRVFLAEERALGRKVVVKVLPPETAGQLSAERFKREIALAAQLQHPHIVPLLMAGDANGLPFFTMPYVNGESLRARLAKHGELPVAEAVRVLREIASALAFAHAQGVVHRDVKPDNVLIAGGAAMVTDFGVAKALRASTGDGSSLTSIGVALGTPAYMSPEQASADPQVDHRADIYSWGVLAYELLTGQPPFASRPPQAMLVAHVSEAPELVTKRRASIPAPLARLVMRCLEKRPADRPQTAEELVRSLDTLATPSGGMEPTNAFPAGTPGAAATWRMSPAPLVGVAVIAILVVAGVAYSRRHASATRATTIAATAKSERRIAVMPFTNVGRDPATEPFADGIADELTAALGKVPGLHLAGRQAVYAYRDSMVDPKRVGQKLGVDALLSGTFQRSANRLKVTAQLLNADEGLSTWTGRYELDARDLFAIEDSIAKAIVGELKVTLSAGQRTLVVTGTESAEAHDLYLQGMFHIRKFTDPSLRRGIALLEQSSAKDPRYAAPFAGLALAWVLRAGNWSAPRDVYPRATRAALRALTLDSTNALAHSELGDIHYFYDWDLPSAERELNIALRLDPHEAKLSVLTWILLGRGQRDSALAVARRAVQADPLSPVAASTLSATFVELDQLDSADVWIGKARDLEAGNTNTVSVLAMLRAQQHRWADCLEALPPATRINSTAPPGAEGEQASGLVEMWRPVCEAYAGRADDAREHLNDLIAARSKRYVDAVDIALGYVALGDRNSAFKWLDTAFSEHSDNIPWLLWRRMFDPIRSDPRFKALEQRVAAAANKAP